MSFPPQDKNGFLPPEKPKGGVSSARMLVWIVVSLVGLYLVVSGVIGIVGGGS